MVMDILILMFSWLPEGGGSWQFSEVIVMAINLVAMFHTSWMICDGLMVLHAACFRAPMCVS